MKTPGEQNVVDKSKRKIWERIAPSKERSNEIKNKNKHKWKVESLKISGKESLKYKKRRIYCK